MTLQQVHQQCAKKCIRALFGVRWCRRHQGGFTLPYERVRAATHGGFDKIAWRVRCTQRDATVSATHLAEPDGDEVNHATVDSPMINDYPYARSDLGTTEAGSVLTH